MLKFKIILFFGFLLLILRLFFFFNQQTKLKQGQYLSFQTTLATQPESSFGSQKLKLSYKGEQITVFAPIYPELFYGDNLHIRGYVEQKEFVSNKANRLTKVKYLSLSNSKIEVVKNRENLISNPTGSFLAVIFSIRQRLINLFNASLPSSFAGLLLGITFGIKESMPKAFLDNLKLVGVVHVIAASGMNVTMTAGFLSSIALIFFKRQVALFVSILGILFYAFLAGFEPSILRASVMGILVFSSQILGRQSLASYSLLLTAFLMLFISPDLVNNLGFRLSFLSTAGILYFQPLFLRLKFFHKFSLISESFATTFSAQLATLPIFALTFGTYSLWSVPVNMLVLWTVPYLMLLGALGAFLGFIFTPLGQLVLVLNLPFLYYFELVVNFFASKGGVITFPVLGWQFAVSYYCFLTAFILFLRKKYEKV